MQKLKSYDGYMFIYFCFALYSTHNKKKRKVHYRVRTGDLLRVKET